MKQFLLPSVVFCALFMVACTPAMKELFQDEFEYAKNYNYLGAAKTVTDWDAMFPEKREMTLEEMVRKEYCENKGYSRQLLVTGISGEKNTYGGCIMDAPVPYEPYRLQGRP